VSKKFFLTIFGGYEIRNLTTKDGFMLGTILIVLLILMLIGALPRWNYNTHWGYAPFGGITVVLVIILILVLLGKL